MPILALLWQYGISIVLTLFALRPMSVSAAGFGNVPAGYYAKGKINYLVTKGIIAGFPDGTFKPENDIIRQELAVFT
jgi:hypothetical protein